MSTLDEILKAEPTEAKADAAPPAPEPVVDGKEPEHVAEAAGTGMNNEGTPPVPGESKEKEEEGAADGGKARTVPVNALQDERRKRQEAEDRLAKVEAEISRLQAAGKPQDAGQGDAAKAVADDPLEALLADPTGFVKGQLSVYEQALRDMRFDHSEKLAVMAHGQAAFEAAAETFKREAMLNPALVANMNRHPDPGQYVMEVAAWAANRDALAEYGGDVRKAIEAAEKRGMERAQQQPGNDSKTNSNNKPASTESLSGVRSARDKGPVFAGPTPLDEILGKGSS